MGIPSVVVEQRLTPGGRSTSFKDSATGKVLDNGQHVLISGYRHTMQFLRAIGTADLLSVQPRPTLLLHHPERGMCRFAVPRLKFPAHLVGAVAGSNLLTLPDRWRLLLAGTTLVREQPDLRGITIHAWLDRHRQSEDARRSFWHPLAISIMNERPDRAAANPFVRSLRDAFYGHWSNASVAIPRVSLLHLYADEACRLVRENGGSVHFGADVREVLTDESGATGVRLRDGRELRGSAVVLAVPPHRLTALAPEGSGIDTAMTDGIGYSPIVSTHLWFGTHFMEESFLGIIDAGTQWVFNRTRIEEAREEAMHVSTVTSAAYDLVEQSNEDIVTATLLDLRRVFGNAVDKPRHAFVIREKRATVSLVPSLEKQRPPQKTAMQNLFLAGDWTHTGYPATIESAVISGKTCAELIAGVAAH
jgi:squalene-associated FAD-dependent desaturase